MSAEKPIPRWILWSAPLVTLMAPALYIIGVLYEQGFLAYFGAGELRGLRSPQEYCVQAFNVFFLLSLGSIPLLAKYAVYIVVGIFLAGCANYFINFQLDRAAVRLADRWRPIVNKTELIASVDFAQKIFVVFSAALVTVFLVALIGKAAYVAGKSQAETQQTGFKGCDIAAGKTQGCAVVMDADKPIIAGMLVSRSATHYCYF